MAAPAVGGARRRLLAPAALALAAAATVAAYAPSLDGGFYLDEATAIVGNVGLRHPARLARRLASLDLLGPARPVTDLSLALDHALGGLEPRGYHLASLGLHLAVSALVLAFALGALRAAGHPRAMGLATFVATAFALHPLQAEAVAYPAQRSEVLSAALVLAGLLLLVRAAAARTPGAAWAWAAAATGAQALALGAKAVAVTLPAAFVLHQVALGGGTPGAPPLRARLGRALALSAPAWALSALAVARNLSSLAASPDAGPAAGALGPARYLVTEWRVLWLYARLAIWPAGQSLDHALAPSPGLLDPATLAAGLAVAAALAGAALLVLRAERGRAGPGARAAAFGAGFWFLALAPTSTVVPIADLVAEHRAYLALAGLLLAAAAAADAAAARWLPAGARSGAVLGAGAAACCALGLALHARAEDWRSPVVIWEDAARGSPGKPRVLLNVAWALQEAGRAREALAWYGRAAASGPSPREQAELARNLSGLWLDAEDPGAALAVLDPAIARWPGHPELRRNRALALLALGRADEAWRDASLARERDPGAPELHDLAGLVLVAQGRLEDAEAAFRRAAELDPTWPEFREHRFLALARLGRAPEACGAWQELVRSGATPGEAARARAAGLGCTPREP